MKVRRKSMAMQEQIIYLRGKGLSQREIARNLRINRKTVCAYWNSKAAMPSEQAPEWTKQFDWEYIGDEIQKRVPIKTLYEELSVTKKMPSYSSFCRFCSKKVGGKKCDITIRVPRSPGESVETDYSGKSIPILVPSTGELESTELFVGTMSYSGKIYAEFTPSQKMEDWIASHNRMFTFFGGVPKFEITDNLKAAVTKTHRYDPEINRTFNDMAKHYGLAIDPADKASPKQKPNVEKAVHVIQQGFFPRIRNKTFTSIHQLNKCLWEYLKEKNAAVMKDRGRSRDAFFEEEKQLLSPLPPDSYDIYYWKKAKVHPDCCFQLQKNFYSVPYRYAGKEVELKFNSKMVYVFFETEQIKCHRISLPGKGYFIIDGKDYPEKKFVHTNNQIQYVLEKARRIGENTHGLIELLIDMPRFPLKNLRKMQGIIDLRKKYSSEAMEYASKSALELRKYNYNFIKSCAKNYREPENDQRHLPPNRQSDFTCLQGEQL